MGEYVDPFEAFKQKKKKDDDQKKVEDHRQETTAEPARADGKPRGFDSGRVEKKSAEEIKNELHAPQKIERHHFAPASGNPKVMDARDVGGEKARIVYDRAGDGAALPAVEVGTEKPKNIVSGRFEKQEGVEAGPKPAGFQSTKVEGRKEENDVEQKKPTKLTRF